MPQTNTPDLELNKNDVLKPLLDILPGGVVAFRTDNGALVFVTDSFCQMTGYSREDIAEITDWAGTFVHPEDAEEAYRVSSLQYRKYGHIEHEFRVLRKNGEMLWVRSHCGGAELGEQGNCIICFFQDISSSKLATLSVRRELDTLTNTIPGGVAKVLITEKFPILLASDGFYRLTEFTREEYHSEPINGNGIHLICEEDAQSVAASISQQLAAGNSLFVEYRIRKKSGNIAWISVYAQRVEDINGIPSAEAVFIDSTASKSTEHRLLNLTNSIPGGVAHLRLLGDKFALDYASEGLYRLTGYAAQDYDTGARAGGGGYSELIAAMKNAVKSGSHTFELDYSIGSKNGAMCWLHGSGVRTDDSLSGDPCFECVFTDITETKNAIHQLEINESRYRLIFDQTQDIVFELDLLNGSIYHSPAFKKKFGYEIPNEGAVEFIRKNSIFPDDLENFDELLRDLSQGLALGETEYRLRDASGEYCWCRIKAVSIFDDSNRPVRAVGIISDVDEYVRENTHLREQAQIDLLTNLYNKITVQKSIEAFLSGEGKTGRHAVYLMDIDNFKGINDGFGHFVGDTVLTEAAARIRGRAKAGDLIGRVGGDEFILLAKDIQGPEDIDRRGQSLCGVFYNKFGSIKDEYRISGSVGAAIYPEHGQHFDELFKKADAALYLSKQLGKDRFCIYTDEAEKCFEENQGRAKNDPIESAHSISDNFNQYIFSSLYGSHNIDSAVRSAVDLASRYYHINEVYIFELFDDRGHFRKTFDFSDSDISVSAPPPMLDAAYKSQFLSLCDNNGVFYYPHVERLPEPFCSYFENLGVRCILQIPIMEESICRGYIGFCDRETGRAWAREEVNNFTLMAKMLGTFLLKRRMQNQVSRTFEASRVILDNVSLRSYVVDGDYTIMYANYAAKQLGSKIDTGSKCYRVLKNRESPCPECPTLMLSTGCKTYSVDIYNDYFKVWEEVTAATIGWTDGSAKWLVTCQDISKYKK